MELDELKKLIRLVEKSRINEIEIEEDGRKVRISKGGIGIPSAAINVPVPPHPAPAPARHPQPKPGHAEHEEKAFHAIKSPMVGTFYSAAAEEGEPFVKEGEVVSKGQTLCIIEAMKLMNEIESDVAGKIVQVIPENGAPIEYGETLFKIDTSV
ncbi:MAG: hypothetical protein IEMM0002_0457 [bacterium]|nr:MAG: hypothetical protein IEMM0002_0457 [bacterium]